MDKDNKITLDKVVFDDYHIHTNITDGECSPSEIIDEAKKIGIKNIIFTEHVRKILTYDWFKFRDEILDIKPKGIKVMIGIEAKVLTSKGELDVSKDVFESADIVLGSVHGIQNVEWLLNSDCDIIAHPQLTSLNVDRFLDCDKIIELNSRYPLGEEIIRELIKNKNNKFSFGSDTHEIEDLKNGQKYFSEINKKYKMRSKLFQLK